MQVLILGSDGLLGSTLSTVVQANGHDVVLHRRTGSGRASGDLSDIAAAELVLMGIRPNVIINLIGLTDVDQCQRSPRSAYLTNVMPVKNIAEIVVRYGLDVRLVQVSTDQVYSGIGPHVEGIVSPLNVYGETKLAGETAAATMDSIVLRTNFFGRSRVLGRSSLSDWAYKQLKRGAEVPGLMDVIFSPLSIETLCRLIVRVLRVPLHGVYNVGSREGFSKACFLSRFAAVVGYSNAKIRLIGLDDLHLLADRPKDMRMNSSAFAVALGIVLPTLNDEIGLMDKYYGD